MPAVTTGTGRTAGAGPVTLARHGGGAGPQWGAYVLLIATVRLSGGGTEAVIAAAPPDQVDPRYGLHLPTRYGPTGNATKPLWDYAAAANAVDVPTVTGKGAQPLAEYLLRIATSARISGAPRTIDLPWAAWEIRTEQHLQLTWVQGKAHGWGGFQSVRIGRLLTVTPEPAEASAPTRRSSR